jgi:hypothetical protein
MNFAELRDALTDVLKKNDIPAVTEAKVTVRVEGLLDPIAITEINLVHTSTGGTYIYLKGETIE